MRYWLLLGLFLTSCEGFKHFDDHDPTLKIPKDQYDKILTGQDEFKPTPKKPKKYQKRLKKNPVPAQYYNKISISITQSVPLKDVLLELSRQAGVGISISPKVTGGLYFQAQNQPFINIIKDICESADLRYVISGQVIKIEPDAPYSVTYNVQQLSQSRENKNSISMATDVFKAMDGQTGAVDNGSTTVVSARSKTDFWEELSDNLETMLGDDANFTLHRQAGLITVNGTQKQQNVVDEYLVTLSNNTSTQVLIEAKILEVNLNEEFKSGINWNRVINDFTLQASLGDIATTKNANPAKNVFTIGSSSQSLTGLVSLLDKFGTVRTLSNPRMTVMNNQSAVLKVATNFVFFKMSNNAI